MRVASPSDIRDLALLGSGVLYCLGYLVVAYHAWRNNVGFLPALDFNYFIAGIVPGIYLFVIYCTIRSILHWKTLFIERVWRTRTRKQRTWILRANMVLGTLILLSALWSSRVIWGVIALAMLLNFFTTDPSISKREKMMNYLDAILAFIPIIFMYGVAAWTFVEYIYPNVPQSFGGIKPKCAQLDLQASQISAVTRRLLLQSDPNETELATVSSKPVDVLFVSGSTIVIHVPPQGGILQLSPQVVTGVRWCKRD